MDLNMCYTHTQVHRYYKCQNVTHVQFVKTDMLMEYLKSSIVLLLNCRHFYFTEQSMIC